MTLRIQLRTSRAIRGLTSPCGKYIQFDTMSTWIRTVFATIILLFFVNAGVASAQHIVYGTLYASLRTGSLAGTQFQVSYSYDGDQVPPVGEGYVTLNSFDFVLQGVAFHRSDIFQGGQVITHDGVPINVTASFQVFLPPGSPVRNITFGFGTDLGIAYIDLDGNYGDGSFSFQPQQNIVYGTLNSSLNDGSLAGTQFCVSFSYDADQVPPVGQGFVSLNSFDFTLLGVPFTRNDIFQGGQVITQDGTVQNVTASFQVILPPGSPVNNITFGFGGDGVIGYIDLDGNFGGGSFTFDPCP